MWAHSATHKELHTNDNPLLEWTLHNTNMIMITTTIGKNNDDTGYPTSMITMPIANFSEDTGY